MGYGITGFKKIAFYIVPLIVNTKPIVQYVYMGSIQAYSVKIKICADYIRGFLLAMHIA
jgi:hypothetical protein